MKETFQQDRIFVGDPEAKATFSFVKFYSSFPVWDNLIYGRYR